MRIARVIVFGVALLASFWTQAAPATPDFGISSTQDIDSLAAQLDDPAKQAEALGKLIKFAGMHLYEGSIFFASNDQKRDELCRYARESLKAHRSEQLVVAALKHPDEEVRNWGLRMFETTYGRTKPWEPYLPLLENMAVHDSSEDIRAVAVDRLKSYNKEQPFLTKLQKSTDEESPWVLMQIYDFSYPNNPELKKEFYQQAVRFLSSPKESERMDWLNYIHFNVENTSTAPMWKIEANSLLDEKLVSIVSSGTEAERKLAGQTLELLEANKGN